MLNAYKRITFEYKHNSLIGNVFRPNKILFSYVKLTIFVLLSLAGNYFIIYFAKLLPIYYKSSVFVKSCLFKCVFAIRSFICYCFCLLLFTFTFFHFFMLCYFLLLKMLPKTVKFN